MKIIKLSELNSVDPRKECFIVKNFFDKKRCETLLNFLSEFSKSHSDNEKVNGENWHYWVTSRGNSFDSFLFNQLGTLGFDELTESYRDIWKVYQHFGEKTFVNNFDEEINVVRDDVKTIQPLVFSYKSNQGKFDWHKHPSGNNSFQLLVNLTKFGTDYTGGETIIYNGEGKPSEDFLKNSDIFDSNFDQGDMFSFPYTRWHKVNPVFAGKGGIDFRVSMLMPLAMRYGGAENEYL